MNRLGVAVLGAMAIAASSAVIVPSAGAQAPPGPRFGENYLLPPVSPARARDIPGLAVNPANQNHIVQAESDTINLQCDYHTSFDGGRTWTGGHLRVQSGANPPFPTPACDQNFDSGGYHHFNAGIVFGSGQNVYIVFSVHRGPFNRPESAIRGGNGDDAVVARSTDGGRTFQPAVLAIPGGGPVGDTNLAGFGMRPGIGVERGAAGGQDRLYVSSWNCYTTGGCQGGAVLPRRIYVARSDNGGANWTDPVLASQPNVHNAAQAAAIQTADEQARFPSQPVIGPDGAVYVAYRNRDAADGTSSCPPNPANSNERRNCIVITRSTDQGQTWQQFSTGVPICGSADHPRLAIDPSTPVGVGTLYVTYQKPANCPTTSDMDIVVQSSSNRAATWSAPARVNDDPAGNDQRIPWVAVGPGGRVDVSWNDRRHTYPGSIVSDTYYARSTNGGQDFGANRRVTDRTINHGVGRMGDLGTYTWYGPNTLPLPDGSLLQAWIDSRLGNFDTGYQDIFLSRLSPNAPISGETIATATPPGLSVRLSRLAYPGGNEAIPGNPGEPVTRPVVANQGDAAGALAGAVLARASWAPLFLSPAGGLPAHVKADAARLKGEGGYVIGHPSQLSTAVARDLRETTRNGENVERITAPDIVAERDRPAEIARRIAEELGTLPGDPTEAVIVNPDTPEGASASALAAALKLPLLFVDTRVGNSPVPSPTESAINSLRIQRVLIVGGEQSVPASVQTRLGTLVGEQNVRRVGGANQTETSEAVLSESRNRGLPANVVYVADGARPTEAAALGAAVGRLNGLMLLRPGADIASAEQRLTAIAGFDESLVDRLVGAIGTGGTDPVAPAAPPRPQPPIGRPTQPRVLTLAGCPPARAARNLISLSNAGDTRNGTPFGDLIFGGMGNDTVDALAGDDCVDLGPGTDRGQGGLGNDFVLGGLGSDRIAGSSGADRLRGGPDGDRVNGGLGNDILHGQAGRDRVSGSRGRDRINGGSSGDVISAGSSNDRVAGDQGSDRINGNSGNDVLRGNSGNDRITGSTGGDRVSGGSGRDRINSRDGRRDRVNCGRGRDRVVADRADVIARNCERVSRRR